MMLKDIRRTAGLERRHNDIIYPAFLLLGGEMSAQAPCDGHVRKEDMTFISISTRGQAFSQPLVFKPMENLTPESNIGVLLDPLKIGGTIGKVKPSSVHG
jgi:hypothetical protein